jgi:NADH dehydrogenase FAD-containing subunit
MSSSRTILGNFEESLQKRALVGLIERGVTFKLEAKVVDIDQNNIYYSSTEKNSSANQSSKNENVFAIYNMKLNIYKTLFFIE